MRQAKRRRKSTRRGPRAGSLAKRLGRRLRELRGEKSLESFAKTIGISKSSLSRIERGEQNVLIGTLDLICEHLGIDIADLFP